MLFTPSKYSETVFQERLKTAQNSQKIETNCFSTAFYLIGALEKDIVIYTVKDNINGILSLMKPIEKPENNSIIISGVNGKTIDHATYVKTVTPFEAYHRRGLNGKMETINSIESIEHFFYDIIFPSKGVIKRGTGKKGKTVNQKNDIGKIVHALLKGFNKKEVDIEHQYYKFSDLMCVLEFIRKIRVRKWSDRIIGQYRENGEW